jgi:ABC-type branched-subunit amino acid transport system substrate-binding protein
VRIWRIQALVLASAMAMPQLASAQISDDVVRIGVLTDLSSWGRDNSAPGSVEAAKMAVEEFGPTVLGKPIEIISADHQMKVDVGTQIAREWFDNGKVDAVADIPNSGIAIAVHNLVRDRNKIALLSDTDVHAIGLEAAQGTYMTTASYWNMDDKTRAWSKKFFAKSSVMPTMIHTGVYGSVLHYLKAIKAAGTDDPQKVMAKMRELPIEDVFVHGGRLREDGRVIRDMYLARVKKPQDSKEPWDYLDIIKTVKGDDAYRPVAESKCPLLKK